MIEPSAIEPIVSQYVRNGWKLRRIILTTDVTGIDASAFPSVSILRNGLDAAWFSRSNKQGETWELRRLSGPPFALVRVVPVNVLESELEQILRNTEMQMMQRPVKSSDEIPVEK